MESTYSGTRLPVYQDLLESLGRRIREGEVPAGESIGTELQLAKEAGLGRNSVRRVIDRLVAQGLLERRPGKGVYVRNHGVNTRTIQVVVPSLEDEPTTRLVRGAQDLGRKQGVQVLVYDARAKIDLDIEALRRLPVGHMNGALIVSIHHPRFAEVLYELKVQGFPFVLVDEQLRDIQVPCVISDNYGGGYSAGQELLKLGHRRLGFVGNLQADTVRARADGLRDAVLDAGLPFDRSAVLNIVHDTLTDWSDEIRDLTQQLLSRPDRPTAVAYSCDKVAAHAYQVIKAMGLQIGRDVSVIGFDDDPLCKWLEPTLSTVSQSWEEMGQVAMELLINHMADGDSAAKFEPHVLPTKWMVRGSVSAAPVSCSPAPANG